MDDNKKGALALLAGALGGTVTMLLHPTMHHVASSAELEPIARLGAAVHALALVSVPLSFLGSLALTRLLNGPDRLAVAAIVAYGYATVAVLTAALTSGFIVPDLARQALGATPEEKSHWNQLLELCHRFNQAFAQVFTISASIAIALWSAAMLKRALFPKWIAACGLVIGVASAALVASGHIRLDVHGEGAVVFAQSAWFVAVALVLLQQSSSSE